MATIDADYVTLTAIIGAAIGDTAADPDTNPDWVTATEGTVTFTPNIEAVNATNSDGKTVRVVPFPIVCTIDAQGRLTFNGDPAVTLLDLGSSKVNPSIPRDKAAYNVTFSGVKMDTATVKMSSFGINPSPEDAVSGSINLWDIAPLATGSGGAAIVRGTGLPSITTAAAGDVVAYDGTDIRWLSGPDAGLVAASQVGAAGGVASLDSSGLIPVGQVPNLPKYQHQLVVDDLTFPDDGLIGHRGCPHVSGPENTIEAYEAAIAAGVKLIELDLQALADGTLAVMHDSTVDRTTGGTGSVDQFTVAGWRTLRADPSTYQGSQWPDTPVPLWSDVLNRVGGRCILVPEVKDGKDATSQAICDELARRELTRSAIIQSMTYSNVQLAAALGIATMFIGFALDDFPTPSELSGDGIWCVAIDRTAAGDLEAFATSMHAAGVKVFGFMADHQSRYSQMLDKGFDGMFSDESLYATGRIGEYRTKTTSHTLTGVHGHGYVTGGNGDGPYSITTRGDILGVPLAYEWQLHRGASVIGELSPMPAPRTVSDMVTTNGSTVVTSATAAFTARDVGYSLASSNAAGNIVSVAEDGTSAILDTAANASGTGVTATIASHTITARFVVAALPTTLGTGFGFYYCLADDLSTTAGPGPDIPSCYLSRQRANGLLGAWSIDSAASATAIGSGLACNALNGPLTLADDLTKGSAITALPVMATAQQLKGGHQFKLPTGQLCTVSATTAAGSTSVPIYSFTPEEDIASGVKLNQVITLKYVISPTTIVVSRPDEAAGSQTITDSTYRGGWLVEYQNFDSPGDVRLLDIVVT